MVQSATTGFLQVLKAQTAVDIRRRALELARTNLDLARDRVQLGSSSASGVYRRESEVASPNRARCPVRPAFGTGQLRRFGLLFATLLTLLFIPVIYTIFFRVRVTH